MQKKPIHDKQVAGWVHLAALVRTQAAERFKILLKNMGQAKQRGTLEQRSQTARQKRREGLEPIDIEVLRVEHDVPTDAKFVGFVVWLRERDEFLVLLDETPAMTRRAYGRAVEAAVQFPTWDEAVPHADASKHPAIVAVAFDMGKQMFVIGG